MVRGVGGRRHEYRPVVSRLTTSCRPLDVARAFRDHFGLAELYVADLDALAGAPPALTTFDVLRGDGFHLAVDAGVRDAATAAPLADVEGLVVGLETIRGPEELAILCRTHGGRVVFSLDLRAGVPMGEAANWRGDAGEIAGQAVATGVRRLLVLDLARVGVGEGTGTEELCRGLTNTYPEVELIAGGGVRGTADLRRLSGCGVRAALVASALHDGTLRRADLEQFRA